MTDEVAPEMTIHLPTPEGHRRGALQYRNGLTHNIDLSPEDLAAAVRAFRADPDRQELELRDAVYGEPLLVTRVAIDRELLALMVAWVPNPAAQQGVRPSGVTVVRDMPLDPAQVRAIERRERRARRLN